MSGQIFWEATVALLASVANENGTLIEGLVDLISRSVDDETRQRASLHVLDWVGCAIAGAAGPIGRAARDGAIIFGAGPCTVVGSDASVAPFGAAFLNGLFGNQLEMDDIHRTSTLHPGPVVVPAALAAAEHKDGSATTLLDAIIKGYETVIRIGRSVGPQHYAMWHNTSTCGPFGAASAVGVMLGLTREQHIWALGNAGAQAAGPWRCRHEPVMTKQLHTGHAAGAGYAAAALAGAGLSGPRGMLEGEQGFFDAMAPDAMPEQVLADGDARWLMWDTSFKPWPACRHAHAAIDAALTIRRARTATVDIERVEIATYEDAIRFCDQAVPSTENEAKFSLQHAVAVTLADGPPDLDAFRSAKIAAAEIAALRARTSVKRSDRHNDAYPAHYGATVTVRFIDGTVRTATRDDALGDPAVPLDTDQLVGKARLLMGDAGVPLGSIDRVVEACLALPESVNTNTLTAALRSATTVV
jgi:2-methylcitrate dehydratase PrpD